MFIHMYMYVIVGICICLLYTHVYYVVKYGTMKYSKLKFIVKVIQNVEFSVLAYRKERVMRSIR